MLKMILAALILPMLTLPGVQASEAGLIDAINKIAVKDRWQMDFIPDTGWYHLVTKKQYTVAIEGGNHGGQENIQVSIVFKVFHFDSEATIRQENKKREESLEKLLALAQGIPRTDQPGLINFLPRNGAEQVLANQVEVMQLEAWYRPIYHYKGDIYISVWDDGAVYPCDEHEQAVNQVIAEHDGVFSLWTRIP